MLTRLEVIIKHTFKNHYKSILCEKIKLILTKCGLLTWFRDLLIFPTPERKVLVYTLKQFVNSCSCKERKHPLRSRALQRCRYNDE